VEATTRKERTMSDEKRNDEIDEQEEQADRSGPISRDTAETLGKGAAVGAAGGAAVGAAAAAARMAKAHRDESSNDAEDDDADA
jgi:hypothetical protein